jgi:DegV family protein with EDD domain
LGVTALEPATKLTADNTRIVVDSPSNVPAALRQQYGMIEVPALVIFGVDAYRDGVDLTTDAFYRRFAEYEPQAPTTSQPPPGFFAAAYRQALEEGAAYVAAFTVTSRLSGTHASAMTAAEEVATDRIFVWDSDSMSMGSGWQAVAAARLIEQGIAYQDLLRRLTQIRAETVGYFTAETLKYAALSGRVSNLQAGVGDLLGVKPVMSAIHGHVAPIARARGRKRSLREVLARFVDALAGRPANVAVMHANCQEEAVAYADNVEQAVSVYELQIVEIGPAIASLIGPGTLGLAGHPVPAR